MAIYPIAEYEKVPCISTTGATFMYVPKETVARPGPNPGATLPRGELSVVAIARRLIRLFQSHVHP